MDSKTQIKLLKKICQRHIEGDYIFDVLTFKEKDIKSYLYKLYHSKIIQLARYENKFGFALSEIGLETPDFLVMSNYGQQNNDIIYLSEKEFFKQHEEWLNKEFDYLLDIFKLDWKHSVKLVRGSDLCSYPMFELVRPKIGSYQYILFDDKWFLGATQFRNVLNLTRKVHLGIYQEGITMITPPFLLTQMYSKDMALTILDKAAGTRADLILCEMAEKIIPIMEETKRIEVADVWIEPKAYNFHR